MKSKLTFLKEEVLAQLPANAAVRNFTKTIMSLAHYLRYDIAGLGWRDDLFDTIINHETKLLMLQLPLLDKPWQRMTLKAGMILDSAVYSYDPGRIIDWLSSPQKGSPKPRRRKTRVEYIYERWKDAGPLITYRKSITRKKR